MNAENRPIDEAQKTILRRLGEEVAKVGMLPVQREKAELWRRLNDMKPVRPMVYLDEEPWPEIACQETECVCADPFLRMIERSLRITLYRWRHYPLDYVIRPEIECPKAWRSTGIGISQKGATIEHSAVTSQQFTPQITRAEDIDKIRMPEVTYDAEETARRKSLLEEIFGGILPVRVNGINHIWFTPWDKLIRLVDIEGIMMDLVDRPEFVNALVSRYVDAMIHELDQIEALGLFDAGAANYRVGSGGYGYCSQLPAHSEESDRLRCADLWGCGNAQIFSEVSPEMHWEFSLKHEMRWLERWGLTYYGCCEQLHMKIDILRKIPNLRKISVSPWFNIAKGLENGAGDYVLSVKPNPAIFAEDGFNEARARREVRSLLEQSRGGSVELVMKDISTVRNVPERLRRWGEIAMEEAERI